MVVSEVLLADGLAAFTNDDQAAIRAGSARDGFLYRGSPLTGGFGRVRQAGQALSVVLVLDDGTAVHGDAVSVQYAGAAGRAAPLDPRAARDEFEPRLRRELTGTDVSSFRAAAERLAAVGLPTPLAYGASQALLAATAHAGRRTVAETVAAEYATGAPLLPVPVFAQTGEDRRTGVDRMILREVEELPHGLINNASALVGEDGELLLAYVGWVRDRVLECRESPRYEPVLHFDCYGTLGEVFDTLAGCGTYLARLEAAAAPLRLRIEQPVQAGSRAEQIEALSTLRKILAAAGSGVELVADEWCNTLDDVRAFAAAEAGHMLQVKTPDLGGIDATIEALLACKAGGALAYCGGSSTDTERAGQICAGVAMGTNADLLLARPGMGVDEAIMVVRNEMSRTRALIESR
jgi:methylaspartate ammonia-lyase